jgi:uncharacterized protein (TIGR02646 family)
MIYVDRKKESVPEELKPGGTAKVERDYAIAYFKALREGKVPPPPPGKRKKDVPKSFEFSAYNSKDIKSKLIKLFNGKCAYCECDVLVGTVGDIEHFRPKGEIVEEDKTRIAPGYYWLASDWDNLLFSCNNCNRKSTQEIDDGSSETVGKGNKFPLVKGSKRCTIDSEDVYTVEEPGRLLLNPCIDKPEDHLLFLENGAVQAKMIDGAPSLKAETSIEVYGLYRKPLTESRGKLFESIKYLIADIKEIFEDMVEAKENNNHAKLAKLDTRLQERVNRLKALKHEKMQYAGLARQVIDPFLKENKLI